MAPCKVKSFGIGKFIGENFGVKTSKVSFGLGTIIEAVVCEHTSLVTLQTKYVIFATPENPFTGVNKMSLRSAAMVKIPLFLEVIKLMVGFNPVSQNRMRINQVLRLPLLV